MSEVSNFSVSHLSRVLSGQRALSEPVIRAVEQCYETKASRSKGALPALGADHHAAVGRLLQLIRDARPTAANLRRLSEELELLRVESREEIEKATAQRDEIVRVKNATDETLRTFVYALTMTSSQIGVLRDKVHSAEVEIALAEDQLLDKEQRIADLRDQLEDERRTWAAASDKSAERARAHEAEMRGLQDEIAALRAQVTELRAQKAATEESLHSSQAAHGQLKMQWLSLAEGFRDRMRAEEESRRARHEEELGSERDRRLLAETERAHLQERLNEALREAASARVQEDTDHQRDDVGGHGPSHDDESIFASFWDNLRSRRQREKEALSQSLQPPPPLGPAGTAFLDQLGATRSAGRSDVVDFLRTSGPSLPPYEIPAVLDRLRTKIRYTEARTLLIGIAQRYDARRLAEVMDVLDPSDAQSVIDFAARRSTSDFVGLTGHLTHHPDLKQSLLEAAALNRFPGMISELVDTLIAAGRSRDAAIINRIRRH
ncbi:hypothetical protein ACWIG4_29825 [Streptomyces sp. NPDC002248]